jgi:3-oxoacyl-[acyl-carrier-protein] synthase II
VAIPLAQNYDAVAEVLLNGRSSVGPVTRFNVANYPCRIGAFLDPLPAPPGRDEADFARHSPWERLILHCTIQALRDSGWWERRSSVRVGVVLGMGAEWLQLWETDFTQGGRLVYSLDAPHKSLSAFALEELGLSGPVATVAAACASGNIALAQGRRWVERGWVDVCLAGGADLAVTPMGVAGFANLGALSKRNDDPRAASRPFDRDRDGFVMGEGGALFVLERAGQARRRGARAYGEVAGFGASSDAFHLVIPSSDPAPSAQAMRHALADAGVNPGDVDYVNAHATSTPIGDRFETKALQAVLGEAVRHVPVSSTKSMTGHLLSAAAAVEALACLVALDRQTLPPTINLDNLDPECDLCHVAHHAQERRARVAISNSFGFGGSNTCLVLRKVA